MSILSLFWFNRRIYAILISIALLSLVVGYWAFGDLGAALVGVAYGTMFLRDIGFYRRSTKGWPVVREVIAWDKVQQFNSQSGVEA